MTSPIKRVMFSPISPRGIFLKFSEREYSPTLYYLSELLIMYHAHLA